MSKNPSINDAEQMEEQLSNLYEEQCKIMVKDNLPENIENPTTDQSTTFESSSEHPFIGVSNFLKMGFQQINENLINGMIIIYYIYYSTKQNYWLTLES